MKRKASASKKARDVASLGSPRPIAGRKPLIFIASSVESGKVLRDISRAVEACGGKPLPWPEAFPVGQYALESLIEASRKVDGALILASADDKAVKRGKVVWIPRDNILVEIGIFVSALSRLRAALVYVAPAGVQVGLPSDLNGLTYLRYDPDLPAHNEKQIREWMARFFTESLREGLPTPTGGHYSWHEVNRGLEYIQDELERDNFRPDIVLGLGRSGGVVGGILASLLGSIPIRLWDLKYREDKNVVEVSLRMICLS
jgi:predicted nucleotide-binding protein